MTTIQPPELSGFADLFQWADTLVDGLLGYLIVFAIGIITYTTITTYTSDERSAVMAAGFMMLITSLSWMYILNAPHLMGLAILSAVLIIASKAL